MQKTSIDDKIFTEFQNLIAKYGYESQPINPNSDLYEKGARFTHIIPDELWQEQHKKGETIIEIRKHFSDFNSYVTKFYRTICDCSERCGSAPIMTKPQFSAGGVCVIYFGLR